MGGARTALFNWLFARQHKGQLVFRIEDTDEERSKPEYEKEIIESLKWLGLDWDEGIEKEGSHGPYRQSERGAIYRRYLEQLIAEYKAYYCYCTKDELEVDRSMMLTQGMPPRYSGRCRNLSAPPEGKSAQVVRLKTNGEKVIFEDMIRGTIAFDTGLMGDFVIAKAKGSALYNFAVTVDDAEMEITHVIRGEDHISNTPKQILIQEALGFARPHYAHLPLVLSTDKKKLSKRYAETSLLAYRDEGYLAEAVDNFLILLGWHPQDNQEVFTLQELIAQFNIKRVQKAGAVFNVEKLDWLNAQHLKRLSHEDIYHMLEPEFISRGIKVSKKFILSVIETERERMKTLKDFFALADFFFDLSDYDPNLLRWNKDELAVTKQTIDELITIIETCSDSIEEERIQPALEPLIAKGSRGGVLWPLRVALSGKSASPDPFAILRVLGKEESLRRLRLAKEKLDRTLL